MAHGKNPGLLDGIAVIVLTVPRQVPYVHQALASIFSSGREVYDAAPLHVVVDSCDTTYLAEYAGHPAIRLHYLTEAEASAQGRRGLCSRFCGAYCRCLAIPAKAGLAVLEGGLNDETFIDTFAMNSADVQAFLAAQGSFLAAYTDPNDPLQRTAANVTMHNAKKYSVNPKLILLQLQKAQTLLSTAAAPDANSHRLTRAMGCGANASSFYQQVDCGAKSLRNRFDAPIAFIPIVVKTKYTNAGPGKPTLTRGYMTKNHLYEVPGVTLNRGGAYDAAVAFTPLDRTTNAMHSYTNWLTHLNPGEKVSSLPSGGVYLVVQVWAKYFES